jgi:hypothetical protein
MLGGSSLDAATEENSGPRVLCEVAPEHPGARAALCYEQTGTVVSFRVLVDETDPDTAMAAVTQALTPLARDIDGPVTRVALDRFLHVLDADGRLLGADVPHWKVGWSVYTVPAQRPVHEVIHEFLTERSQRADGLRQASAQRSAATRRERGSQRGGRQPALTAAQQAQVYDEDQARTETRKDIAARWQISVPTLTKYLRAEQQLRAQPSLPSRLGNGQ